jgi:hypothetical protein
MTITPAELIARHVQNLNARPLSSAAQLSAVLERAHLRLDGNRVVKSPDVPVTHDDCYWYKQAVKEVFGETAYSFARVNFILGGCRCRDCTSK